MRGLLDTLVDPPFEMSVSYATTLTEALQAISEAKKKRRGPVSLSHVGKSMARMETAVKQERNLRHVATTLRLLHEAGLSRAAVSKVAPYRYRIPTNRFADLQSGAYLFHINH